MPDTIKLQLGKVQDVMYIIVAVIQYIVNNIHYVVHLNIAKRMDFKQFVSLVYKDSIVTSSS